MQIILLEKVVNLGNLGDVVKVKDGYARFRSVWPSVLRRLPWLNLKFAAPNWKSLLLKSWLLPRLLPTR